MREVLKKIKYSDVLLGMLHGFGLAMEIHPARGTLYLIARTIIENKSDVYGLITNEPAPRQLESRDAFRQLDTYINKHCSMLPIGGYISSVMLGAAAWLGDPDVLPEDMTESDQNLGMLVAQTVLEAQAHIEAIIISRLINQVLIDQTNIANVFLGTAPDDSQYCWLVTEGLGKLLMQQRHEVVICEGSTYWWQQSEPLSETTLLESNPSLQVAALSLMTPWW
jgi:hypothetical protein